MTVLTDAVSPNSESIELVDIASLLEDMLSYLRAAGCYLILGDDDF